ncbi:hypothetical protein C8J56DRAFT_915586 [Mycena floridula]|nr:hypothetical protein C8J56DRAFT_915586 [Mycena floridula]
MYTIFLGAPSIEDIDVNPDEYNWTTFSPDPPTDNILPPSTLDAAKRRISLLYENIIFRDEDEPDSMIESQPANETTALSFRTGGLNRDSVGLSFLNPSASRFETQETRETQSVNYSDTSSIVHFPSFHFDLNSLTSLASMSRARAKESKKVALLLAVLEVEGPDIIRIHKGVDAGKEISILKLVLGDNDGICKLTAWREIAEKWAGEGNEVAVKRGDIVFIENAMATFQPSTPITISASPHLNSKLQICYRSLPHAHEDMRLRPDLRLGSTDPSVKKVTSVLAWFEKMAGL